MFVVTIERDMCKGCGLCIEFCPRELITLAEELSKRGVQPATFTGDPERCTGCGNCAAMCAEAAIEIEERAADTPVAAAAAENNPEE